MKRFLTIGIVLLLVASCSSIKQSWHYAEQAHSRPFDYFFPSASVTRSFASLDEAYDFINTAKAKLERSTGKRLVKGLAAKLKGPSLNLSGGVTTVGYFFIASSEGGVIDISTERAGLEDALRNTTFVACVFLVFNSDRAVSISNFYRTDGYQYKSNSQYLNFKFKDNTYETEYPIGWGLDKAFQYLRKEID